MKGRLERDGAFREASREMVLGKPRYMYDFFYFLENSAELTRKTYLQNVLNFLKHVEDDLEIDLSDADNFKKVKASHVRNYLSNMNIKNSFKKQNFYAIKKFFKFLLYDGYINVNPCEFLDAPVDREHHEITVLTRSEIEKINFNIDNPVGSGISLRHRIRLRKMNKLLFNLALITGLREGSLAEINLEDIDHEHRQIRVVQKGNKIHIAQYSDNIEILLNAWLEDREEILREAHVETDALFITPKYLRMHLHYFEDLLDWASYNVEKKVTPHKLRSTAASHIYNHTGDIYLTGNILGHSDVSITARYAKLDTSRERKAMDVMDKLVFGSES